jgi:hypothetical protein
MNSIRERLRTDGSAPVTPLTGTPWVHSYVELPSFFRFGGQTPEEKAPRGVGNRFTELRSCLLLDEAPDVEVLVTNHVVSGNQVLRELTGEIEPLMANVSVRSADETFRSFP